MMALAAVHVARLNLEATSGRNDRYEAAVLGSSGVENGLMVLDGNRNWRTDLSSGVEYRIVTFLLSGISRPMDT